MVSTSLFCTPSSISLEYIQPLCGVGATYDLRIKPQPGSSQKETSEYVLWLIKRMYIFMDDGYAYAYWWSIDKDQQFDKDLIIAFLLCLNNVMFKIKKDSSDVPVTPDCGDKSRSPASKH